MTTFSRADAIRDASDQTAAANDDAAGAGVVWWCPRCESPHRTAEDGHCGDCGWVAQ